MKVSSIRESSSGARSATLAAALACFSALAVGIAGAQGFPFEDPVFYSIGTANVFLQCADVNHDNALDLVACQPYAYAVHIWLGHGDGSFTHQQTVSPVGRPVGLIVADLNGDTHPDVAAADAASDLVRILLGDGTGNFAPGTAFSAGNVVNGIQHGDFDNDGHEDLVVVDAVVSTSLIRIYSGAGDGTFVLDATLPVGLGPTPRTVVVTDLDCDEDLDIAVGVEAQTGYPRGVWVYLGDGAGNFVDGGNYPTGQTNIGTLRAGDIDGDSYIDLVCSNYQAQSYSVFLASVPDPSGNVSYTVTTYDLPNTRYPLGLEIGDFDCDGNADLAICDYDATSGNQLMILQGNGDGTFTELTPRFSLPGPHDIWAHDLNGDGALDLAVTMTDGRLALFGGKLPASAQITGVVTEGGYPLGGVIVDLYDPDDTLLAIESTGLEDGTYAFTELDPGDYVVSLVLPLGYVAAGGTDLTVNVSVPAGGSIPVDFALERLIATAEARGHGYWKHEYKVHDSGHGQAQFSLDELEALQQSIYDHFYAREDDYALRLEGVTHTGGAALTFDDAMATLSTRGSVPTIERAKQRFLALLLNVVSDKVATYGQASEDGSTISQVITFIGDLLEDGNPANDDLALDLAEMVNSNELIPAAMIDPDTPDIAYRRALGPLGATLSFAQPNPANSFTRISYTVPSGGAEVSLRVYDQAGRLVRTLVQGPETGGIQQIVWLGDDDQGHRLAGGVYFYEIRVGERSESRRVILW